MFVHGPDWSILSGEEQAISQSAYPSSASRLALDFMVHPLRPVVDDVVWNFPFSLVFKAQPESNLRVHLRPCASAARQRFVAWATGCRPEYVDPQTAARSAGREEYVGKVKVCFNILFKDIQQLQYSL
ncbi:b9-c2 domain-containing protein [Cystoisospora suis]|uniref:B9-c2 domain-containing protein n=1 Tax=Cystoisospora suis TaxID=483139 RepID=A0A2C6LBT5_9APIC|nr:b9-c2 domain-containing protein [Cystoisospora suis]